MAGPETETSTPVNPTDVIYGLRDLGPAVAGDTLQTIATIEPGTPEHTAALEEGGEILRQVYDGQR